MRVTVQAIETAFHLKEIRDGEAVLQGLDEKGGPGECYQMSVGDTFHIAYDASFRILDVLLALVFNTPLRLEARQRCNCRWDKTTHE